MKKTRIKPVSDKQRIELQKRRLLRYQLFQSQNGKCAKCSRMITLAQTELSHKKSLARGGKTEEKNCEVLCANWLSGCHPNEEHGLRNKYNEQPKWSE
jgi:5-methylcytosine-specific restriction endonuclease McrA